MKLEHFFTELKKKKTAAKTTGWIKAHQMGENLGQFYMWQGLNVNSKNKVSTKQPIKKKMGLGSEQWVHKGRSKNS